MYHRTKYWLWLDNPDFGYCIYKRDGSEYKEFLKFEPNVTLHGGITSASFALDFAIKQGYKKAELYGILDGKYELTHKKLFHVGFWQFSYIHFYDETVHNMEMMKLQGFKQIINSYTDRIDINIPYLSI